MIAVLWKSLLHGLPLHCLVKAVFSFSPFIFFLLHLQVNLLFFLFQPYVKRPPVIGVAN